MAPCWPGSCRMREAWGAGRAVLRLATWHGMAGNAQGDSPTWVGIAVTCTCMRSCNNSYCHGWSPRGAPRYPHAACACMATRATQVDAIVSTIGFPLVGGPAGTMEGGRQAEVAKAILTTKNVPYSVAAPLLIQDMESWSRDGVAGRSVGQPPAGCRRGRGSAARRCRSSSCGLGPATPSQGCGRHGGTALCACPARRRPALAPLLAQACRV